MKKGTGSQKGSAFERDVACQLSLWWTQDLDKPRDDVFWRTSVSGARATSRSKKQKKTAYDYGDITFRDPIGKPLIDCFLIECKRGYSYKTNALDFFESKSLLFNWIDKIIIDSKQAGRKNWLLILSRNRRQTIIFMNSNFFGSQFSWSGFFPRKTIEFSDPKIETSNATAIKFEDFLKWINPVDIISFKGIQNVA